MTDAHDITGGLDLLGDWLDAKGYTEEAGLCTKAMDEINRLQEKLNGMLHCSEAYDAMAKLCSETEWTLNEKIDALRAENARLREALNNIAAQRTLAELTDIDKESCDFEGAYDLLIRAARSAMGDTK